MAIEQMGEFFEVPCRHSVRRQAFSRSAYRRVWSYGLGSFMMAQAAVSILRMMATLACIFFLPRPTSRSLKALAPGSWVAALMAGWYSARRRYLLPCLEMRAALCTLVPDSHRRTSRPAWLTQARLDSVSGKVASSLR